MNFSHSRNRDQETFHVSFGTFQLYYSSMHFLCIFANTVREKAGNSVIYSRSICDLLEYNTNKRSFNRISYKYIKIMKRKAQDSPLSNVKKVKRLNNVEQSQNDVVKSKERISVENTANENPSALPVPSLSSTIANQFLTIERDLCTKLKGIEFKPPVAYVYNPLNYAFDVHSVYVRKYCNTTKKILFLGINPGPWGMSQTGVPFGEISMVRDWLRISGPVGKPDPEHPERKITGFECPRSEVSGRRLWGLFQELCGIPENFFRYSYVHNYCPLALMNQKAANITPAELKGNEQLLIHSMCDEALADILKLLKVEIIVGIGRFAEKRAQTVAKASNLSVQVLCLPHPSPRAVGNSHWDDKAKKKLEELKLLEYLKATISPE